MLLVRGFNGLGQLTNGDTETGQHKVKNWLQINDQDICYASLSWSGILIISNGNATVIAMTKHEVGRLELKPPEELIFVQGSCCREKCLLVTKCGRCWNFCLITQTWNELTGVIRAETPSTFSRPSTDVSVVKVCAGETLTAFLTSAGTVHTPSVLTSPKIVVTDIACGREHGIFLTQKGTVYTWGGGGRGQLGSGTLESSEEPVEVEKLSGLKIVSVAAGGWHSCAVVEGGILYSWGWNKQGQLGHSTQSGRDGGVEAEPHVVKWPKGTEVTVEKIACGTCHTIAVLDDKTVWGCGWNSWGQLSNEEDVNFYSMTRLIVPEENLVNEAFCGAWNTALLCS